MHKSKRDVIFFVIDMIVAIDIIKRHTESIATTEELSSNEGAWFVVTRQLEIIGEAMKYIVIEPAFKQLTRDEWRYVVGLRNIVAHEYFNINAELIFDIIKNYIPELENDLIELLQKFSDKKIIISVIEKAQEDFRENQRTASVFCLDQLLTKIS